MNPNLSRLHAYPFARLNTLLQDIRTTGPETSLALGEPQHRASDFFVNELKNEKVVREGFGRYPATEGSEALRVAISEFITRRYSPAASIPDQHVLPVNGTREAIFAAVQAAAERTTNGSVVMPNPFYQIYEGAAFMAGLTPHYLPITESGQPDYYAVPDTIWKDCQFCFICTPGNPTGTVIDEAMLTYLIGKAQLFDFWLASDECYSEIYRAVPPPGLLEVCSTIGNTDFKKCMVFHSLSKSSNLPGLRSGFVAGDADFIGPFLKYGTYHGCSMSMAVQKASELAWADEEHVIENRALYAQKFRQAAEILGDRMSTKDPGAGFYLWAKTPNGCDTFSRELFEATGVTVLPGQYLGREVDGINPGAGFVRMALVAEPDTCREALERIKTFITR